MPILVRLGIDQRMIRIASALCLSTRLEFHASGSRLPHSWSRSHRFRPWLHHGTCFSGPNAAGRAAITVPQNPPIVAQYRSQYQRNGEHHLSQPREVNQLLLISYVRIICVILFNESITARAEMVDT